MLLQRQQEIIDKYTEAQKELVKDLKELEERFYLMTVQTGINQQLIMNSKVSPIIEFPIQPPLNREKTFIDFVESY